jgi:hypothetical protein
VNAVPRVPRWVRILRRSTAAAFAAMAASVAVVPAWAAPAQGRSLAVSVPPEPTPIAPGEAATIPIRVLNPGPQPVTVTVTGRQVELGDNGSVAIGAQPDPRWQNRVVFPTSLLTIAGQGFIDIPLVVQMPVHIDPDLYFVGFLVTPIKTGRGDVQVINQIGSFITVDVPGPRLRRLTAELHVPGFHLGSSVSGVLQVHNIGRAAARFWGENDVTSSPGKKTPQQQRIEKSTIPIGKVRSFQVSGSPHWPIGFVTMSVRITYPDQTESATKDITVTKRVLVISPWVPVVAAGLAAATITWWVRRHHRNRAPERHDTTQARRRRLLYDQQ